jgi:hypothetical protein
LSRGKGAEEGWDLLNRTGGAWGRKMGAKQKKRAKWKKGKKGAKLRQEGRRKCYGEEEESDAARNYG